MKKKVVIAHCWGGTPEDCWYQSAKKEIEARGFEVIAPEFPDTENPQMEKWVAKLTEAVGEPHENISHEYTFLIGHSLGTVTILRYLETLPEGQKIGGVILVAPYVYNLGFAELDNFFKTPIDYEKIKSRCVKFFGIFSDNDPYVPLSQAEVLKEKLDMEILVKHNAGHFSNLEGDGEFGDSEDFSMELTSILEKVATATRMI